MPESIRIEIYSRPGCHLCDEAKELIERRWPGDQRSARTGVVKGKAKVVKSIDGIDGVSEPALIGECRALGEEG